MNFLIIGMPNVGKTSLFNLIVENKYNIIHESVGTTRDWHSASLKKSPSVNIFDTPGIIVSNKTKLDKNINKLIKKIDIFLFVLDFKNENYTNNKELINIIRKFNKDIILIINKDDNFSNSKEIETFGIKKKFFISCAHKLGINEFIDYLKNYEVIEKSEKEFNFSIGLFGKTNVGKSTLLNKLVGYDRSVVSNIPKTTTDIVTSSFNFNNNNYFINDTAGLIKKSRIDKNSLDYYTTKKTLSIIRDIDVNLFLIDVEQGFDTQSKKIFNLIYNKSNIILFIINKIDLIKKDKKIILNKLKEDINHEFSQSKNIHIINISAFDKNNINNLKKYIHKLTSDVAKNISTSKINIWLKNTINKNPHSRIKGKEVKFKYATQISSNPLTIKIFSNFSKEISIQYKRFLINNFYEYFKIKSKKIKIIFSKSLNPFS